MKPKGDTSQFWKDDGEYDFSVYDRIIEESMRENPTAYLIVYIDAYPSQKWAKANPGELLRDETGETSHCIERSWYYETNYSFSSEKAAKSIEDMVSAVIAESASVQEEDHRARTVSLGSIETIEYIAVFFLFKYEHRKLIEENKKCH